MTAAPRRGLRIAATAVGVVGALVLGEVAACAVAPAYAERVPDYAVRPLPGAPPSWTYAPGSTVSFVWDGDPLGVLPPGARQSIAINRDGLRGPVAAAGSSPVVFLGDSFTFGEGVPDDATFVARVGKELGWAVVNAGVAGQGTVEEAARLPALLEVRPRALVLVFVPNDAIDSRESGARGGDLLRAAGFSGSRLLALVRGLFDERDVERWYLQHYVGAQSGDWRRARRALAEMSSACKQHGVPFGVTTFPLLHDLDDHPFAPIHDAVREACAENDVALLDLLPAFRVHDARRLWAHPADRHPNAAAHALAAEALTPFVRDLARR